MNEIIVAGESIGLFDMLGKIEVKLIPPTESEKKNLKEGQKVLVLADIWQDEKMMPFMTFNQAMYCCGYKTYVLDNIVYIFKEHKSKENKNEQTKDIELLEINQRMIIEKLKDIEKELNEIRMYKAKEKLKYGYER